MKKVVVGMAVLAVCAGMAMAGTKYIKYSCGCTEAVGSIRGADQTSTSSKKCADCAAKEQKAEMCTNMYGKVPEDVYKENCN